MSSDDPAPGPPSPLSGLGKQSTTEPPPGEGAWENAASLADLPPGKVMEVVIGTTVIALAHAEGAIFAIDGICAHQGGPLGKARLEGCQLTCPWHGWQYDLATGKQLLSRTIAQRVFSTRVVGDTIQVRLPPIG